MTEHLRMTASWENFRNTSFIEYLWEIAEASTGGVLQEIMFLEIFQNLQEKICGRVFF